MKILHISDLHFKDSHKEALNARLNFLVSVYPEHHIIITGDITDNGTLEEYQMAERMLADFKHIYPAPGNHDYCRLGNFYTPSAVGLFNLYLGLKYNCQFDTKSINVKMLDPRTRLIILDSNLRTHTPADFACGEIGFWQRRALQKELVKPFDGVTIVALHHHPFIHTDITLRLKDDRKLLDLLYNKCQILLFGHDHKDDVWTQTKGITLIHAADSFAKSHYAFEITINETGNIGSRYIKLEV